MGYSIKYIGKIAINPPLNAEELEYLSQFVHMWHISHERGPYFIQNDVDFKVINRSKAEPTTPSKNCDWIFTEDGTAIKCDNRNDRFYLEGAIDWMRYLIEHFLKPDPIARQVQPVDFGFLRGHILNGTIKARIDEFHQNFELIVLDNIVLQREIPKTAEETIYYLCPHCQHTIPLQITIGPLDER